MPRSLCATLQFVVDYICIRYFNTQLACFSATRSWFDPMPEIELVYKIIPKLYESYREIWISVSKGMILNVLSRWISRWVTS
jgi:hypothetical protein